MVMSMPTQHISSVILMQGNYISHKQLKSNKYPRDFYLPLIFLSQEGLDNIEVSNKGVVRNARTGHIYTPRMSIEGYLFVYVKFPRPIHRLVASTHQPENYRPGLVVDHKDERRNCNWNSNLEFKDQRANPVAAIGRPVTVTVVEGRKIIAIFDCLKSCKDFYNGKVSGIHKKLNLGKPFDVTYNGEKLHFDVADTKFVNRQTRTFYKDSYDIRKFRDGTAKPSFKSKEVIQRKYKVETNVVEKSEMDNLFSKKSVICNDSLVMVSTSVQSTTAARSTGGKITTSSAQSTTASKSSTASKVSTASKTTTARKTKATSTVSTTTRKTTTTTRESRNVQPTKSTNTTNRTIVTRSTTTTTANQSSSRKSRISVSSSSTSTTNTKKAATAKGKNQQKSCKRVKRSIQDIYDEKKDDDDFTEESNQHFHKKAKLHH